MAFTLQMDIARVIINLRGYYSTYEANNRRLVNKPIFFPISTK
jgi:hypothetical protein